MMNNISLIIIINFISSYIDTIVGLRSILWVPKFSQLWIANEDLHRVIIVDRHGQYVGKIKVKNPIGLLLSPDLARWVG